MNIDALIDALESPLDTSAKFVIVALAARARRDELVVRLPVEDVVETTRLSRATVWRASRRAVKAGYLTVENTGRSSPVWTLRPSPVRRVARLTRVKDVADMSRDETSLSRDATPLKEVNDSDKTPGAADNAEASSSPVVEKSGRANALAHRAGMPPDIAEASRRALKRAR